MQRLRVISQWVAGLLPAAFLVDARERWRAVLGAGLGILVTAVFSLWAGRALGAPLWMAAPIGASAVLVFALPASPLAQPWPVLGGNTLSACVGLACAWAVPDAAVAAGLAVALAMGTMFVLRCLHPPGGAVALLAVLAPVHDLRYPLLPVLLNSALLVAAGVVYNRGTGRRYPHAATAAAPTAPGSRFTPADLDTALAHYNQVLDVSRDDLEALLHQAEAAAYRRNLGELRCGDIMSRPPVAVSRDETIADAWALMRQRRIKALPVVDKSAHLIGIVTLADFVRHMDSNGQPERVVLRVKEIMSRRVRVASADLQVIELLPLFSEGGHHHLPIVDADRRLVGIVTQSDLVRALHRAVKPD